MSDKINRKVGSKTQSIPLTNAEFAYINSLDAVGRSFEYYIKQLKSEYLQGLTLRMGYKADDNLEMTIDLKDEAHLLIVTKLPIDKPQ